MTRLTSLATAAVACLAASTFTGTVSAQSSTSGASASSTVAGGGSSTGGTVTMTSGAVSSAATAASAANGTRGAEPLVTVEGTVPAYANGTQASLTATIEAVWSTHFARGALTQGLTTLLSADNQTVYGVVLEFNETTANLNYSSTLVPWIATISCDSPIQSYTLPESEYSGNGSMMASANGTAGGNETVTMDLLQQAQDLGAKAILMYSSRSQSCTLNSTSLSSNSSGAATTGSNSSTSVTIPVFSTASQNVANIILQQFMNVAGGHRYFNSTLLTASTSNLTQALEAATQSGRLSGALNSVTTDYLLARINPTYNASDSSNGVVATIGRAPSLSASSTSQPAATGTASQSASSGSGTPSSGAPSSRVHRTSKLTLAGIGFTTGAVLAGIGLLL